MKRHITLDFVRFRLHKMKVGEALALPLERVIGRIHTRIHAKSNDFDCRACGKPKGSPYDGRWIVRQFG